MFGGGNNFLIMAVQYTIKPQPSRHHNKFKKFSKITIKTNKNMLG